MQVILQIHNLPNGNWRRKLYLSSKHDTGKGVNEAGKGVNEAGKGVNEQGKEK